jgi:GT2 family glycosyltransferase
MTETLGMVAIGRNEGERLRRCLESLQKIGVVIVYIDSGSNDGSVKLARQMGAEVVELDLSIPFNASRARNAGLDCLQNLQPNVEFVHFIDADCTLADGWLEAALAELERNPRCAVVCGQRRELHPETSIYNRLCDVEWAAPAGEVESCGGDALMRIAAFKQVGGFDVTVPAGEEPELCQRLRKNGWKIIRLPNDMTWHDAAMTRFSQWWRRQFRGGYNGLDVARRFGLEPFGKITRSARVWTLGPLGLLIFLSLFGAWAWGVPGVFVAIVAVIAILLLQAYRIGRHANGLSYGAMTLLSKWAQLWGQIEYFLDQRRGRTRRLIEYKQTSARSLDPSPSLVPKSER